MPRNGAGTYSPPAGNPVVTGTSISSTVENNTINDIASALTASISNDGQTPIVADLPMSTYKHTGVGAATATSQYARADQVQNSSLTYLSSVSGTNTITGAASVSPAAYAAGQTFVFVSAGANTGAVTLNVSGLGAKSIKKNVSTDLSSGDIPSGATVSVTYDGTNFQLTGVSLLSASSGSSLVGFIQAGTGAAARTTQAKLREVAVSVKDFGAVGNGVTDDTSAIQAAFTYCLANLRPLYFPSGTYLCSSTINFNVNGAVLIGDGFFTTKIKWTAAVVGFVYDSRNGYVYGISFDGNSSTGTTGVVFYNAGQSVFDFCEVRGWSGDGGLVNQSYGAPAGNNNLLKIHKSVFVANGGRGLACSTPQSDGNGVEVMQCWITSNTSAGLLIKAQNWRVVGGIYENNGTYGIQISEPGDASFAVGTVIWYPWIENNTSGGVRGGGKSARNRIVVDSGQQDYSAAAGSEDLWEEVGNNAGPYKKFSDGTIEVDINLVSSTRGQIQVAGTPSNIPIYLMAKGTSAVAIDPFGTGGMTLGGGSVVKKFLTGTATWDPPNVAAGAQTTASLTVTGAALGDTVVVSFDKDLQAMRLSGYVSAANTVSVVLANGTAGAIDLASGTLRADVWQH